ncbi:CpsD/CapB family tyrosine-protein kinase [Donghicola sp. C2-DW-16]|uniref:CpsD/CapB family tyrosine-protein kinase n=1 Tax=Donghicola mangrovi TaxID=2729614 RepID=A0ABX2PGU3_9RHOB|nr:CpsD/CapB family tyrosine-protein kinase [Donghicola mangrovi]NVO28007.1 CpsD/CapB family tyrosine-protein kinase [Donghicola mangrovi]
MERLQAALQKARAQRETVVGEPARLRKPRGNFGQTRRRRTAAIDEVWQSLPEMEVNTDVWQLHRLFAYKGGADAAPFDLLRTKLLRLVRQHKWKRVAILSANADAGKSTTVANLALSFARQKDIHAMAIDFDLRRPSMGRLLGQHLQNNMGQVLRGEIPFERHVRRLGMNMAFAMNDLPVHQPAELLQSQRTEDFIKQIEEKYSTDLILFDMPPMMVADDAHGFLRWVDAALIVIEAEKTPVKQIDILERQVAELTNVAGIVLNKCNYSDEYTGSYNDYY